ncbi:hypothetical protein [Streptosporangium vulgare]|uniref:hypothetical protein n=1 Tax=Streptosporangium vulgare TaxID=46190 RepID=UPI0031E46CF2
MTEWHALREELVSRVSARGISEVVADALRVVPRHVRPNRRRVGGERDLDGDVRIVQLRELKPTLELLGIVWHHLRLNCDLDLAGLLI